MNTQHLTHRSTVQAWECDHMGHMNVRFYMHKFDDAAWTFLSMMGLSTAYMQSAKVGPAAVDHHVQYKKERLAGDSVVIHSNIVKVEGKKFELHHVMSDALTGDEVANCTVIGVFLDREKRKAIPCPEDIKAKVEALL